MIERHWNAGLLAKTIGALFVAVGLIGFTSNPFVSPTGYFMVNATHNFVHIVTGLALIAGAMMHTPAMAIRAIAVLYAIVAVVGFGAPAMLAAVGIDLNVADQWLHGLIAAGLLLIGFLTPAEESFSTAQM